MLNERFFDRERLSKNKIKNSLNKNTSVHPYLSQKRLYDIGSYFSDVGNKEIADFFELGLIQAKLNVNKPGDIYEQEADKIANDIVSSNTAQTPKVNNIKRRSTVNNRSVNSKLELKIKGLKGKGNPLNRSVKEYFESRFGVDLGNIRIHTGNELNQLARSINAKAFTYGNDIVFGEGQYQPHTTEGKKLIAHELTHTIQQGNEVSEAVQMKRDKNFDITNTEIDFNKLFYYLEKTGQTDLLELLENALLCSDVYDESLDLFLKVINEKKYELQDGSYIHRFTEDELRAGVEPLNKTLDPTMFEHSKSGFFSALYYNKRTEKLILVFRGTEGKIWLKGEKQPEAAKDWNKANILQALGLHSEQYTRAMLLAEYLVERLGKEKLIFTGHSLGGGLAAAASIIVQKKGTITFNSAGLHENTTRDYNEGKSEEEINQETKWKFKKSIKNYYITGEKLTAIQKGLKWLTIFFNIVPLAAGKSIRIKPAHKFKTPLRKHQMSEIIESIIIGNNLIEKMNKYYQLLEYDDLKYNKV